MAARSSSTPTLQAVALMGATGTGKSALAMRIAEQCGCPIICCDSMQLYRGLDIGTAKPTVSDRQRVLHYLVDCCDLPDLYSAARWANEVRGHIRSENRQGRTPMIVGGTGLYLRALLQGFAEIPPEHPEVRQRLESLQQSSGTDALYRLLQDADPEMASRLKAGDTQRIMRALAVFESSGKPLSEWQRQPDAAAPIDCPIFVLDLERKPLRTRLADRFHTMIETGWLDEVRWLADLNLPDTHPAMRSVGYRQLLQHLRGEISLDQAISDGITATRRYAKRQVTWFHNQTPDALYGEHESLAQALLVRMRKITPILEFID